MTVKIVLSEDVDVLRVALCFDDSVGKYLFRVLMRSAKLTASGPLYSFADVDVETGNLRKRIEASAGALAEYQNTRYKDRHDPEDCARLADKMFVSLLLHLKEKGLFG